MPQKPSSLTVATAHEGAIKMAQKVTGSTNEEVAALASAIIEAQEKELAFMKELIKFY